MMMVMNYRNNYPQYFSKTSRSRRTVKNVFFLFSEWRDPKIIDHWPIGMLTEKAILRIPLKQH